MNPQIAAIDDQIKQTETIMELQKRDEEIIRDLEGLQEGQEKLNNKVDTGFEKGRKRMDGIEEKVDNLKEQMTNQHNELLNTIKDQENQKLKDDISKMMKERDREDGRLWDIVKMVVAIILGAGAAYLGLK